MPMQIYATECAAQVSTLACSIYDIIQLVLSLLADPQGVRRRIDHATRTHLRRTFCGIDLLWQWLDPVY